MLLLAEVNNVKKYVLLSLNIFQLTVVIVEVSWF